MTKTNLSKCPSCKLGLISEEVSTHKCMRITDYWVRDGIIWLGDGVKYYPMKASKLNTKNFNNKASKDYQNLISRSVK